MTHEAKYDDNRYGWDRQYAAFYIFIHSYPFQLYPTTVTRYLKKISVQFKLRFVGFSGSYKLTRIKRQKQVIILKLQSLYT